MQDRAEKAVKNICRFWLAIFIIILIYESFVPQKTTAVKKEAKPVISGMILDKEYVPKKTYNNLMQRKYKVSFSGRQTINERYEITILYGIKKDSDITIREKKITVDEDTYNGYKEGDFYHGRLR